MSSHLTRERISEIKTFFSTANVSYDSELRSLLTDGIHYQFVGQLTNFGNDAFQLSGDLNTLNSVERLEDGTIPFEMWLRNAVEELSIRDTAKVLSLALDELTNRKSNATPISEPTRVPNIFEVRKGIRLKDDMVAYGFLAAGFEAGKAVARLQVPRHDNGTLTTNPMEEVEVHHGTGWLLAPDLLITNHHVVNARIDGQEDAGLADLELQASNTKVQFDYDGKTSEGNALRTTKLEAFDKELDYAVLRLESPLARKPLLINHHKIEIDEDSHMAVNIIQHPNGGPKRVALRNNLVYDSSFPKLRYFTDTQHGSSGSPVFNDSWQVVALHRASTFVDNVKFQGRSSGWVNEGTQLAAIVDDMKLKNTKLYETIKH